ncbi:hypothetical protein A3860_27890 [Niastella vici]|uniref:Uncharacterized protein n=1 Tax=Niastella vici TaxID=1703345 RepID=A0A1V9FW06_9BACT|nr:hypothetical protein [Niastella vici]OQP62517.1 hypothetical protein A3860_27890 [Niastella vici]
MKIKSSVILLLGIILFVSCKKDVDLIIPTILTTPLQAGTLDTVKSSLVASATVDGDSFRPDSCHWQVLDNSNNQVAIISSPSDTVIYWVPQHDGDYRIIAKAFMGKNSVTANAQIHVQNTPATIQRQMVGKWHGSVTTPWQPVYEVDMEFFSNGQYSAHSTNSSTPALYYGVDTDSPDKTFQILSLDAAGANGNIVIYFWPGDTKQNQLKAINLSNNNNNLNFEIWDGSHGPRKYVLDRK